MLIIIPIWSRWSGQRALAQMALPPSTTQEWVERGGGGCSIQKLFDGCVTYK